MVSDVIQTASVLELKDLKKLNVQDASGYIVQDNGTGAVTISNVAPAGVTTATIAKWLIVEVEGDDTYYIPMWT